MDTTFDKGEYILVLCYLPSQAHMWPQGWNNVEAFLSEHTTHSSIYEWVKIMRDRWNQGVKEGGGGGGEGTIYSPEDSQKRWVNPQVLLRTAQLKRDYSTVLPQIYSH